MDRAEKRTLTLLVTPIIGLVIASYVGTALSPKLVVNHPTWLLALDSRNRHLLLTVGAGIDPAPYFTIAFVRLLLSDPLFYVLGYRYGDGALRWIERKTGDVGYIRLVEKWFAKARYVLVALMPNNLICTLAGAVHMRPRVFLALNLSGTLVRLGFFWFLGKALADPLDAVLDFIQRWQNPLLIAAIVLVALNAFRKQRAGTGELESPARMEAEIEAEVDRVERGDDDR